MNLLSACLFVFGVRNIHRKVRLTYSGGTNRLGKPSYSFSMSNNPFQVINFPTRIPCCDSHSPDVLVFFVLCDPSICSTVAYLPLGNSDHFVFSVSLDFSSTSGGMILFIALLLIIRVLIGSIFVIIWKMFHWKISLNVAPTKKW